MLGKARTEDLVIQDTGDELLIYDLKKNKAICLNETSAEVWRLLDGKTRVPEIAKEISHAHGEPVSAELILFAIDQLNENNLLENVETTAESLTGLSRREVIRKIGIASTVALPLVSTMVAPVAATAQSVCTLLQPGQIDCTGPNDCCSGSCLANIPRICCIAGALTNRMPGTQFCNNDLVFDANAGCCSASATLSNNPLNCIDPNAVTYVCDPYPV